jgi:hypothetical protein
MNAHVTMNTNAHAETSGVILDEFFGGGGQFQQVRKKAMRRPGRSPMKQVALQSLQSASEDKSFGGKGEAEGDSSTNTVSPKRAALKKSGSKKVMRPPRPPKSEREVKDLHLDDRNVVSDLIHRVTQLSGLVLPSVANDCL